MCFNTYNGHKLWVVLCLHFRHFFHCLSPRLVKWHPHRPTARRWRPTLFDPPQWRVEAVIWWHESWLVVLPNHFCNKYHPFWNVLRFWCWLYMLLNVMCPTNQCTFTGGLRHVVFQSFLGYWQNYSLQIQNMFLLVCQMGSCSLDDNYLIIWESYARFCEVKQGTAPGFRALALLFVPSLDLVRGICDINCRSHVCSMGIGDDALAHKIGLLFLAK